MKHYTSHSVEETKKIAENLAKEITQGVIALSGNLGAGKTTFIQGFAQGLGIKDKIISPTFVLIRQHKIPNFQRTLYHIDLYRIEDAQMFKQIGLEEILSNPNNIVLIEWAKKIKKFLPQNTVGITIENIGHDKRLITID